jgi:hypothetical protein
MNFACWFGTGAPEIKNGEATDKQRIYEKPSRG